MDRRPAPKDRRTPCPCGKGERRRPERGEIEEHNYPAPSHTGGSFAEAGYTAGRGTFGFTQHTVR